MNLQDSFLAEVDDRVDTHTGCTRERRPFLTDGQDDRGSARTLMITGLTVVEIAASADSGAEYLPRWPAHCAPDAQRTEPN
jgi:hypothetical protein